MLFKKDNKIMPEGAGSIILGDVRIFNPTAEQLISDGWQEYTPPTPKEPIKRYSKLKIIRMLGDQWPVYKQMIEDAGFSDEFWAANELAEDDPAFSSFLETVPDDLKHLLDECQIW